MRYATIEGVSVDVNDISVYDKMEGFCRDVGCGSPVVAFKGPNAHQRGGTGQRFHFRHRRGYGRGCCYEGVSPLHDFAERCLECSGGLVLPDIDFEGRTGWESFLSPVRFEQAVPVRVGRRDKGFRRPDVVTDVRAGRLAIEIAVTCSLSRRRIADLHDAGYLVLEIMLDDLDLVEFDEVMVRDRVVERADGKFWRIPTPERPRRIRRPSDEDELVSASAQGDLFETVPARFWK